MRSTLLCTAAAVGLAAACIAGPGDAEAAGLLTPRNGQPALTLQDHVVEVVVEDGYAVTTIDQVFRNPHGADLEAVYSFPVPAKGAVSNFTYWIDGKPVHGEVLAKEAARQAYAEEKAAGREAALAEQDGHKTFDITVWPVRANADVRVRLTYMQPAHVDTGVGRYVYPLEEGGVDERKLAFWTADETVAGRFSFDLTVRPAYPVAAVRVASHPGAQVTQSSDGAWKVHIDNAGAAAASDDEAKASPAAMAAAQPTRLDGDVVVYWRHAEGLPGRVDLVAHRPEGADRGTFMLTLTPGDDLKPITEGSDWVFVLDRSGSMQGKIATLIEGVGRAIEKMRPDDRFRLIAFNEGASELTSGYLTGSPEDKRKGMELLAGLGVGGGTDLHAGLRRGLDGLEADRTSAVLLVTDGVANVGETSQRAFLKLARQKDVRLFTFVMGNGANEQLLRALARESGGASIGVSNSDDIVGALLSASGKVSHEALHGAKLSISGVKTGDVTPQVIGSLYRGQQLVVFGHYWGAGEAQVKLSARVSGAERVYQTSFRFPEAASANPEIERLWAFAAIEDLMLDMEDFGEKADAKQAVVDLAVQNGLVTPYTSMVVMREERFAARGVERRNATRVATEQAASAQRAAQAPQQTRVDAAQPMFTAPAPTYAPRSGGGGALGLPGLLLALGAAALAWRGRRAQG